MAKPDINLLGATYSGVAGVTLPTSGGGTATFPWVEGSETKTANGTYDVTNLAQLIVNVSGGGGTGLVYETGTYTPTADIARPTISFANTHADLPIFIMMSDSTGTDHTTASTNYSFSLMNMYSYTGQGVPSNDSANRRYALASYVYRASGNPSQAASAITNISTGTSSSYMSYWVTTTGFIPSSASTTRYWRSGRTYKWIAVWKPTS